MLFVSVFEKTSKPDQSSLQPRPSPTKNRHAPQQTGLRPDHCATQPHSTLFVSNQKVFPGSAEMRDNATKHQHQYPHQHQYQHQHQQSFRISQCDSFTLCLLTTAGLVGSRKLLSSNSTAFEIAVRLTGSSTGADWRAQEFVTPSQWTSLGRSSWRANARMAPSAASNGSCALRNAGPTSSTRWQCWACGAKPTAKQLDALVYLRSLRRARQTDCRFSRQDLGQDENQGAGADCQVCSRTPRHRVGSDDHGCISARSTTKQRGTPSCRVPGQRAGCTRMGQGFARSRSPGVGNSTGQGCCHPNPVPRSRTKGRDGPHCSGHGAAEPRRHGDAADSAKPGCTSGCMRAGQTKHGGGRISLD